MVLQYVRFGYILTNNTTLKTAAKGGTMPIHRLKKLFVGPSSGPSRQEAMKVFQRDRFKCQYCGLDSLHNFANWLVLTIDHIHPHAHGGARKREKLGTACRPSNLMKGTRA